MLITTGIHAPVIETPSEPPTEEFSSAAIAHLQYEAGTKDKMLSTDLEALNRTKKEMAAIIAAFHPAT